MLAIRKINARAAVIAILAATVALNSCSNKRNRRLEYAPNMYISKAYRPDQPNRNFKNGQTAQAPPTHTTPVGFDKPEENYPNTLQGYELASKELHNPLAPTKTNLEQGKTLFIEMCSHCHGLTGEGDGAIIKLQKFPPPPSYSKGNSSRGGAMKDLTDGKIFHTITYGLNLMGPHRYQLTPKERWAIVLYVRELQKLP